LLANHSDFVATWELERGYVLNRSINKKVFNLVMREPGATFHAKAKRMYLAYIRFASFVEKLVAELRVALV